MLTATITEASAMNGTRIIVVLTSADGTVVNTSDLVSDTPGQAKADLAQACRLLGISVAEG